MKRTFSGRRLRLRQHDRAGYDGMGRVSVTHVVERGYSAMLKQPPSPAA